MRFYDDIADDFHGERADVTRKRHTETTPRIYPGDVIDVDGRIIRIPKETPVTRHPETTTEWLEGIALELHAITDLLNERLPRPTEDSCGHPNHGSDDHDCAPFASLDNSEHSLSAGTSTEPDDDPLVQALFDANEEFEAENPKRALLDPFRNLARAAREHIEAERPPETDWEGLFGVEQRKREKAEAELETVKTTLRNVEKRRDEWKARAEQAEAERDELRGACNSWQSAAQEAEYLSEKFRAERDEWQAKFEQTDTLLSRTRDECDKYTDRAERWAARYAALREDVHREYRRTDYPPAHIALKDIIARDDERGRDA